MSQNQLTGVNLVNWLTQVNLVDRLNLEDQLTRVNLVDQLTQVNLDDWLYLINVKCLLNWLCDQHDGSYCVLLPKWKQRNLGQDCGTSLVHQKCSLFSIGQRCGWAVYQYVCKFVTADVRQQ